MSIQPSDVFSFNYYTYDEPFTGSEQGMRYRISHIKGEEGQPDQFEAAVWPEPYAEENTDPELIVKERFPFTEDGKEEAVEFLNDQYQARVDLWSAPHSILD